MSNLLYEIDRLINTIKSIEKIDKKIERLNKKNLKEKEYSLNEKIVASVLVLINVIIILVFFTHSTRFIGIDLVQIFFYSNNIVLTIIILILLAFSSIEISIFMIDYLGFKKIRDKIRIKTWEKVYKPKIENLKLEKEKMIKLLHSDKIPTDYINLKMLYYLKYKIKFENMRNIENFVENNQDCMIKYRCEEILTILKIKMGVDKK
ncbi:hypothetical protein [Alkalithermobacter paradoxus]|uniref:Uncharacterized protein n=1 Tax=Alkalithermobacter paradoxus TaxID=29349 RepID=A0A1V4I8W3_9FIRM|nr:hypothetical protein CLOTH_07280 [[Clostridium] thermoalcaliphilum]